MHRAAIGAISILLAGCTASLPPLRQTSIKDAIKPDVPASTVVRRDVTISPPVVIGGTEADNRRLALALENALTEQGYDVKPGGPWRIIGAVNAGIVTWTITAHGTTKGTVRQTSTSTPALQAIVPGVTSHLPRPSTPI